MDFMNFVKERAKNKCPSIVYAEGDNPTIIETARRCFDEGICKPLLLGDEKIIRESGVDLTGLKIIDMASQEEKIKEYAKLYEELEDFPAEAVIPMLQDNVNFAAMMLRAGDADAMIAGFVYTTEAVVNSSQMFVGLAEGVLIPSSYVIMDIPGWKGSEGSLMALGDCSMVPQPDAEELASIAMNTADSVNTLLGWEPRIGMLSFSTTGSASHKDVDMVCKAVEYLKEKRPELCIGGELQLDAAVSPRVSEKKVKGENQLKGEANVLIFPDLDAGNIGCKLLQFFSHADLYGAIMCGFAKPLTDLSRSMKVEDILGVSAIVAAQVQ